MSGHQKWRPPASFPLCHPPSCPLHPEAGLAALPDAMGMSLAPTQLGMGWGSRGSLGPTLHLTRGPGPWVIRGRRGAWEAYVFLSPCPALNAYLTSLSLMRLPPTYGDFPLPLSFMKRTIHLLSHLRHLAMTGGHQNSHPMLSRNKGKGSQASGSPPVMGLATHPKQRTRPSQHSSAWRGSSQVLWG